jgi:hypothetical protein
MPWIMRGPISPFDEDGYITQSDDGYLWALYWKSGLMERFLHRYRPGRLWSMAEMCEDYLKHLADGWIPRRYSKFSGL